MLVLSRRKLVSMSSYFSLRLSPITIVFSGSARPRQTFVVADVALRVVSMHFYSKMVRSLGATLVASTIMTAEAST
jgi:tRNA A37 threonylcarbamoyladenosine synthetase subunit TsaC/SUA5/YrdC